MYRLPQFGKTAMRTTVVASLSRSKALQPPPLSPLLLLLLLLLLPLLLRLVLQVLLLLRLLLMLPLQLRLLLTNDHGWDCHFIAKRPAHGLWVR